MELKSECKLAFNRTKLVKIDLVCIYNIKNIGKVCHSIPFFPLHGHGSFLFNRDNGTTNLAIGRA